MKFSLKKHNDYTSLNKTRVTNIVEQANSFKEIFSSITTSQEQIRIKTSSSYIVMTKEQLAFLKKTQEFRKRLREGETREEIMAEAFALCREATKRKLGMFHYDVQIEAAAAMGESGVIAEMKTGEGKTLVQILTAYLYALEATKSKNRKEWKSVHVITSNEYLAKRDQMENAKVFTLLGLSSGYVEDKSQRKKDPTTYRNRKKAAYNRDIVYGTAKTIAFDFLDDNCVKNKENIYIRRGMYHAIVDEADSILIDQATKPLVISGNGNGIMSSDSESILKLSKWAMQFIMGANGARKNKVICEVIDQKAKATGYTSANCVLYKDKKEVVFTPKLYDEIYGKNPDLTNIDLHVQLMERDVAIQNAILAMYYYKRGKDYELVPSKSINENGKEEIIYEVVLLDPSTSRLMHGTRIKNGIQEALEAKEAYLNPDKKVKLSKTKLTTAQCTFPDFFSQYETGISGMTGTSDMEEFESLYHLKTYIVPTHKKNIRIDEPEEIYYTLKGKYKAIIKEILKCRKTMQPVLVGTTSIGESDRLCKILDQYGIRYHRLDAVNNKYEEQVVASAGLLGSITIATNMAGRGTDIKLGPGAREVGGLYVIGTSKNINKRIDDQLRGRASRQGDPGKTKFFMSLEDELVKRFIKRNNELNYKEDERVEDKKIIRDVNTCQEYQEGYDKSQRYSSILYDEKGFREHRVRMYEQRKRIVEFTPKTFKETIERIIDAYTEELFIDYSIENLTAKIGHLVNVDACYNSNLKIFRKNIISSLNSRLNSLLVDPEKFMLYSQQRMLKVVDAYWISHIAALRDLQSNIQIDENSTIEDYERQASQLFISMNTYIRNELLTYVLDPTIQIGSYNVDDSYEYTSVKGVSL